MIALGTIGSAVHAEDKLLNESVQFNGTFIFLGAKVPGMIFGAVRNGETAFAGFGETTDGVRRSRTATRFPYWLGEQGVLR